MHCSFYRNFFLTFRFKFNLINFQFFTRRPRVPDNVRNSSKAQKIVKKVGYHSNQLTAWQTTQPKFFEPLDLCGT